MQNQSLTAQGTDLPFSHKSFVSVTHEQNVICSKTLICRQLFGGDVVGSQPMTKKAIMHRMICITYIKFHLLFAGLLCHFVPETKNADHNSRQESAHHCDNKELEQNRS